RLCNPACDVLDVIVQTPVFMDNQNYRYTTRLESRSCEITAKRAIWASVLHPEPLNVFVIFGNAGGDRWFGRRGGLRHDLRSDCCYCGGNGSRIYSDSLHQLPAIESSINIEMNQVLYLFLVGFGWTITIHVDLLRFAG